MAAIAWRIVKAKHVATAFDGEGARRHGGRWNEHGAPMVYLGGSLALAALEIFVHLTAADTELKFVTIQVDIPSSVAVHELKFPQLPKNWREEPPPHGCKTLGTAWVKSGKTAVMRVPSVIVPSEFNYLVNPEHRDVRRLKIHPPQPFGFDNRMWK